MVMRRLEREEHRTAEPVEQDRRQGERGDEADREAQRDRGPRVLDLGEAGEPEHTQTDDHRPRARDERPADLLDRLVERLRPRPAPDQLLAIAGDQEQAVIGPRAEEHHDHEDVRDVDDLEVQQRQPRQPGNCLQRRPRPRGRLSPGGSRPAGATGRRSAGWRPPARIVAVVVFEMLSVDAVFMSRPTAADPVIPRVRPGGGGSSAA